MRFSRSQYCQYPPPQQNNPVKSTSSVDKISVQAGKTGDKKKAVVTTNDSQQGGQKPGHTTGDNNAQKQNNAARRIEDLNPESNRCNPIKLVIYRVDGGISSHGILYASEAAYNYIKSSINNSLSQELDLDASKKNMWAVRCGVDTNNCLKGTKITMPKNHYFGGKTIPEKVTYKCSRNLLLGTSSWVPLRDPSEIKKEKNFIHNLKLDGKNLSNFNYNSRDSDIYLYASKEAYNFITELFPDPNDRILPKNITLSNNKNMWVVKCNEYTYKTYKSGIIMPENHYFKGKSVPNMATYECRKSRANFYSWKKTEDIKED